MEKSDESLVAHVRRGNSEAFALIVDRYKVQIFNLMYRFSNKTEDASDMTQEVFCRAFERLSRYQERQQFFSWLYSLALNYAKDWQKKKNNRRRGLARFSAEAGRNQAAPVYVRLEADQAADSLDAALKTLPDDRREMVILRYRHERSIRELAEIFDLSESAVKMRLHRALEDLRNILK